MHAILTKNMFCYDMKSLGGITFQPKNVFYKLTLSNTRNIKFVNFKMCFAQFCRKVTGYTDMLMMCINLHVLGHIQKFTKEIVFCNCY